ncbi:ATPase family AAA domain-containing protein 5 isoform X2 [Coregonus clupeaformis]|uniref:ATPase family AAA domain-containing protein 5 isoform X2 n=1 Tax=Coregonus clupeaformis TaxID=59861 RepID=UPI001E1C4CB2|nr:ATPase family AAA domain-containing protein 5 isoform X2 [Coregonus clupeaformis]
MEKKNGRPKSNDITKYFSITPQPLGRKRLISEQVKEKPKMAPCHIGGSYDEVPLSVSRSTSRLHRLKQNRYPKARTSLVKDSPCSDPPNNVIVISESSCSSADTAFRSRAVMGSVDLAQVTGQCHGAGVGLTSGQNEIPCTLTIQAAVQSASGTARVSDEKVASIFTRKHSQRQILNWWSSSTLKRSQTERKGSITSGWRDTLSGSVCKGSLEEVKVSNPLFSVRRVFTMLLKKYKENLLESESPETEIGATSPPSSVGEKRKHQNEREDPETVRKRQRSSLGLEETSFTGYSPSLERQVRGSLIPSSRGQPRRSRLSRTQRLRQQQHESQGLGIGHELTPNPPKSPQKVYPAQPQRCQRRVHNIEDLLWTEKYRPQHSSEVIGNPTSVKKLHSWLKKWKLRADSEEKRKERERKLEENANSNDSWDCGDFQGEAGVEENGEEDLCSTMLITGPPGVGKTASVYACAQELGFKFVDNQIRWVKQRTRRGLHMFIQSYDSQKQVFEVNASSQRSGRDVLTQLKEATQSHLVEIQGSTTLESSHLRSYNTSTKSDTVAGKVASPRKIFSSSRKGPQPPCSSRHKMGGSAASMMLANFFKKKSKPEIIDSPSLSTKQDEPNIFVSLKTVTVKKADIINPRLVSQLSPDIEEPPTGRQSKRMSTSLILFEEVDVIFDDDVGFLTAIKTFMTTTKRPVILTTSDPSFSAKFDGDFKAILFKTPSVVNVCSYLQLLCLAENVRTDPGDITSLVSVNQGDIRRSLLQLQLWICSGGGQVSQRATPLKDPAGGVYGTLGVAEVEDSAVGEKTSPRHPPCDVGCTQSMLGLLNSDHSHDLQTTLKCQSWAKPDIVKLMEILTESWRRGVALLYSNLEVLLPLPVRTQPSPLLAAKKVTRPRLQSEPTPPDIHPHPQVPLILDQTSPVKVSSGSRLRRKKCVPTSDSRSAHSMLVKPYRASLSLRSTHPSASNITETVNDKLLTEKKADGLVYHCLGAITDFMDLMSFIDISLPSECPHKAGPCRPGAFLWTGAEIKDGLLDEMREEDQGSWRWGCERTLEIKAAVEGMGFQRCLARVSGVWTGSQRLEGEQRGRVMEKLTLPVAPHRQGFRVSQTTSCDPSMVQRRYDIIRTVLSSRAFCTLGSKQAVAVDYLPVLRTICQSERTQEQGQGRFLHYLSSTHLGLPKATVRLLADDFP